MFIDNLTQRQLELIKIVGTIGLMITMGVLAYTILTYDCPTCEPCICRFMEVLK